MYLIYIYISIAIIFATGCAINNVVRRCTMEERCWLSIVRYFIGGFIDGIVVYTLGIPVFIYYLVKKRCRKRL
jgi:hypothetical protein